jgi:hypothetical protein
MKPGEWNWTQDTDLGDGRVDRMSRLVCVAVPIVDDLAVMDAVDEGRLDDLLEAADPAVVAEIESAGRMPVGHAADTGRGASGFGIAIAFGEALATAGGAVAAIKGTVMAVRSVYRGIGRKLGRLPVVSLGAAEHLAAADFIERHESDTVTLVGSGDVMSNGFDRAFTGGDAFWVILGDDQERLHHYQVDGYGRVTYIGTGPRVADHWDPAPEPDEGPS